MTFKAGQSGNPVGRQVGSKNRKTVVARELEKDGSELAQLIKDKARAGDTTCMSLWLARLEPPLRQRAEKVIFDFDPEGSCADQAKAIMCAVADGRIDPDTGKQVLDMLSALVGLRDVETFINELKNLRASKTHIPGSVVTT